MKGLANRSGQPWVCQLKAFTSSKSLCSLNTLTTNQALPDDCKGDTSTSSPSRHIVTLPSSLLSFSVFFRASRLKLEALPWLKRLVYLDRRFVVQHQVHVPAEEHPECYQQRQYQERSEQLRRVEREGCKRSRDGARS